MGTGAETADLIVIGAGAGGLTAAREGVRRGARTVLIADGEPGGDCTFTGCVPSKTLLAAAASGLAFTEAVARVHDTVAGIAATEDTTALEREGIDVVRGRAGFVDSSGVSVAGRRFSAPRIVVATGSSAAMPPIEGLAGIDPLTNENVFDLDELPARLAVLGGGPIGCELAQAFADLGSGVTVLEMGPRLLARDEPEASEVAQRALEARGVAVRTAAQVTSVASAPGGTRTVQTQDGSRFEADRVLVATGRAPVTAGLAPERAGVALNSDGAVVVDDTMATTAPGIWAIGDVTGTMAFTHAAARMASAAVNNAFAGRLRPKQRFDRTQVPWVTFLDPEIAHVGMTEREAAHHGGRVAWLPLDEVDRALTTGRTDGFVKLIAGPRRLLGNLGGGKLLGATIVAPRAGEMIHEGALAMRTNMFTGRLAQTVHAYPSWSLAIQETAAQFFTEHRGRTARPAEADPS